MTPKDAYPAGYDNVKYQHALREGESFLARADPLLRKLIRVHGPCQLSPDWRRSPYEALVRAIILETSVGRPAECDPLGAGQGATSEE